MKHLKNFKDKNNESIFDDVDSIRDIDHVGDASTIQEGPFIANIIDSHEELVSITNTLKRESGDENLLFRWDPITSKLMYDHYTKNDSKFVLIHGDGNYYLTNTKMLNYIVDVTDRLLKLEDLPIEVNILLNNIAESNI